MAAEESRTLFDLLPRYVQLPLQNENLCKIIQVASTLQLNNEGPQQFVNLFILMHQNTHNNSATVQPRSQDCEKQIRPYIPKYNLFQRVSNSLDNYIEPGDEIFDTPALTKPRILLTHSMRSKGLARQFHLTLEDLRLLFSKEGYPLLQKLFLAKIKNVTTLSYEEFRSLVLSNNDSLSSLIYNELAIDNWNQEQVIDMMKQKWLEQEQVVLSCTNKSITVAMFLLIIHFC